MRKAFEKIEELIALDKPKVSGNALEMTLHLSKAFEEIGELAQSVNKLNGRKKWKKEDTELLILDNIEEEAADAIQCIMAVAIKAGVKYDSLKKRIKGKNKAYQKGIEKSLQEK